MKDTCEMIDDVEQLLFQNTSLMNLMQGFCIMAKENAEEMEYLTQVFNVLLENQKNLQTKIGIISDSVFKIAYSEFYNSISP